MWTDPAMAVTIPAFSLQGEHTLHLYTGSCRQSVLVMLLWTLLPWCNFLHHDCWANQRVGFSHVTVQVTTGSWSNGRVLEEGKARWPSFSNSCRQTVVKCTLTSTEPLMAPQLALPALVPLLPSNQSNKSSTKTTVHFFIVCVNCGHSLYFLVHDHSHHSCFQYSLRNTCYREITAGIVAVLIVIHWAKSSVRTGVAKGGTQTIHGWLTTTKDGSVLSTLVLWPWLPLFLVRLLLHWTSEHMTRWGLWHWYSWWMDYSHSIGFATGTTVH